MLLSVGLIVLSMAYPGFSALFKECNEKIILNTDNEVTINSPNFPEFRYKSGSSCRYTITTDVNYAVDVDCMINIDTSEGDCNSQRFYISPDGISDLRGAEYFCNGTVVNVRKISTVNTIVIAYTSENDGKNGFFSCKVRRIKVGCDCGWSASSKIYNGEETQPNEFISMVGLVSLVKRKIICGGTIISQDYFLTTAHCFVDEIYNDATKIAALVGDHDVTIGTESIYSTLYKISKIIKHQDYNPSSNIQENDIALVQMASPFVFNRGVGPSCLPWNFTADYFDNKYILAAGYGMLNFGGDQSAKLQKVSLQILPANRCEDSIFNPNKVCSYGVNKDTCTSDSGAALYFVQARQYAVGLVSYGRACGTSTPSVNTRITSYLKWIQTNTQGDQFCRK